VTRFDDPWPHYVLDDYLPPAMFDDLAARLRESDSEKRVQPTDAPAGYLDLARDKILRHFDLPSEARHELTVTWTGKGRGKNLHREAARKLLSIVVYISPHETFPLLGTLLFRGTTAQDCVFAKEIEWRPNRAFVFARSWTPPITWHTYANLSYDGPRFTFGHFVVSEPLEEILARGERPPDY
jgi:hypothetical protein